MEKTLNSELKRKSVEEFKKTDKIPLIVVLDNIRSLNNIGSMFRTCDAFLVEAIYLCGITACPPNRDIQKTALGATESVDWKYFNTTKEAVETLKHNGYKTIAIEQAEQSIELGNYTIKDNKKLAIVFGNELNGVEQDVMDIIDECIEINQYGTKHSLNISVCAGIVIWELFKKLQLH